MNEGAQSAAPELSRDLGRRELATVIVVSTLLNSTSLKLRRVLELSMEAITDALDAEAGSIFLLDEERDELEIHVPTGAAGEALRGIRIPRGHGLVGWVVDNGQPLLIEDAAKDPRFSGNIDDETGFTTRSVLAVPLKVRGRVIGALEVLNRRGGGIFKRYDVAFMGALANQVAVALENARLYSALEHAYEEVKRLDEKKSDFIAVAAHELLTPLTVLSAQVELLEHEAGTPDASAADLVSLIEGVRKSMNRMTKLSQDLINMMMVERDQVPVEAAALQLGRVVEQVVRDLGTIARRRRQELMYDMFPSDNELTVYGDERAIKHALNNLLVNAIRFTPDDGTIQVIAADVGDEVRVTVKDTGIGIPSSEHERVFESMYEVQSSMQHSTGTYEFRSGGLGIGLAITKGIIDAHKGRIWLESEEGRGATFTFALPAAATSDKRAVTGALAALPQLAASDDATEDAVPVDEAAQP